MRLLHAALQPDGDGPFPAVVALHGYGAHALDLLGLSQHLPAGLLWLCPQAPLAIQPGAPAYSWFHFEGAAPDRARETDEAITALDAFLAEAAARYPIDPARTALLGFSQGGMLGYRLVLGDPGRFAGFAALSTAYGDTAVGRAAPAEALAHLPVLVQHGTRDPLIAVERARDSRDRLRALGIDVEYREYAMAHEVSAESARDLGTWLTGVLRLRG